MILNCLDTFSQEKWLEKRIKIREEEMEFLLHDIKHEAPASNKKEIVNRALLMFLFDFRQMQEILQCFLLEDDRKEVKKQVDQFKSIIVVV